MSLREGVTSGGFHQPFVSYRAVTAAILKHMTTDQVVLLEDTGNKAQDSLLQCKMDHWFIEICGLAVNLWSVNKQGVTAVKETFYFFKSATIRRYFVTFHGCFVTVCELFRCVIIHAAGYMCSFGRSLWALLLAWMAAEIDIPPTTGALSEFLFPPLPNKNTSNFLISEFIRKHACSF